MAAPENPDFAANEWRAMGISDEVMALVAKAGYRAPTPIQAKAIPLAIQGKDLIASARTGSGKTAGFCLPMIELLKHRKGTYGLILCPTREIALQTHEALGIFGAPLGVKAISLIGGTDVKADRAAIMSGPSIIVGTPGRICDHLERGNLWLEFIEILVLDEADRMLDMGFAKELSRITDQIPQARRQTLLFSATMPKSIELLARKILKNPERVGIGESLAAPKSVDQEVYWVSERSKRRELIRLLQRRQETFIVFTRTKDEATHLWRAIHAAGIHESTYISSNKSQAHREEALAGFKEGRYRVLVATDVAGRGIHVENVGFVVNYEVPREPEDYIHRIGRTGRKDQRGNAITFATFAERKQLAEIESVLGERIPERYARDFKGEIPGRSRQPVATHRSDRGERRGEPRRSSAPHSPLRGTTSEPRSGHRAEARDSRSGGHHRAEPRDTYSGRRLEPRDSHSGHRSESREPRSLQRPPARDSESGHRARSHESSGGTRSRSGGDRPSRRGGRGRRSGGGPSSHRRYERPEREPERHGYDYYDSAEHGSREERQPRMPERSREAESRRDHPPRPGGRHRDESISRHGEPRRAGVRGGANRFDEPRREERSRHSDYERHDEPRRDARHPDDRRSGRGRGEPSLHSRPQRGHDRDVPRSSELRHGREESHREPYHRDSGRERHREPSTSSRSHGRHDEPSVRERHSEPRRSHADEPHRRESRAERHPREHGHSEGRRQESSSERSPGRSSEPRRRERSGGRSGGRRDSSRDGGRH